MKKVAALVSVLVFVSSPSNGQEPSIPEDLLQDLTRDLSAIYEMQQEIALGYETTTISFLEVTRESANLFAGASNSSETKGFIPAGSELRVIDQVGEWYAVSLGSGTSAWVQAADVVPRTIDLQDETPYMRWMQDPALAQGGVLAQPQGVDQPGWTERKIQELLRSASDMRDRYRDNQHIEVTGFSLVVGFPPSISVDFDFK